MDAEEPPLQLLRDGSSLHSLDVSAVQLEEPAPLSPHSERKALLSTSPPMVPAVVQNSIDYLHSKGVWSRGWGEEDVWSQGWGEGGCVVMGVGVGWDGSKALADVLTVTRLIVVFYVYVTILLQDHDHQT